MTQQQPLRSIAIFGSADIADTDPIYLEAFEAAKLLALQGYRLVNGGGPGVMQAVTQGAESVGGQTLTVTFKPENAPYFEGSANENQADATILASDYGQRVALLINNADAFVIFKGGTGTISEWAMVWLLAHIYYGVHKPFVLYGDFWHEVIEVMRRNFFIEGTEENVFRIVNTKEEMLSALAELDAEKQALQEM